MALENRALEIRKEAALTDVQQEYPKYFDALKVHPRLLVGNTVPAIGREGTETLRDSADAKDWQDAVKQILAAEVQERARAAAEEDGGMMRTLHDAIELFQNNADMVPGTKQFDRDLADEFARMAKPYELRVEGKMSGYTIPVQPLINQIREQLAARRAKAATPPAAVQGATTATGKAGPASAAKPAPAPPQAGIQAKAGAASEAENFDALFGTIGLSGFRI